MKLRKVEYHNYFPIYGQCISGRVAYWQKMGVALGIVDEIKILMRNRDISTKRYITKYDGLVVPVIIPTKEDAWFNNECPVFSCDDGFGIIDMLSIHETDMSFHLMIYDSVKKSFRNGLWHTVREGLTLEQTVTLYEYVVNSIDDLIILAPEDRDKYNESGAIGVEDPYLPMA